MPGSFCPSQWVVLTYTEIRCAYSIVVGRHPRSGVLLEAEPAWCYSAVLRGEVGSRQLTHRMSTKVLINRLPSVLAG